MEKNWWLPSEEVMKRKTHYEPHYVTGPSISGLVLKSFVWILEAPILGRLLSSIYMRKNKLNQHFSESVIPDVPMFLPQFPEFEKKEPEVKLLEACSSPCDRVAIAMECLPEVLRLQSLEKKSFRYWTIRNYAEAYKAGIATPSEVVERFLYDVEDSIKKSPTMSFFLSIQYEDVRRQAAASTARFKEGKPLSVLDGILIAVKDDIDCLPYDTSAGTSWIQYIREARQDATCILRLRECGAILVGKTNMHEIGLGITGSNPLMGSTRNPHNVMRHAGGSSSGAAAIVSSGLCPAAIGTDEGGSIRLPAAFCGVVGLKTTYGRTTLCGCTNPGSTMKTLGPIAATVEDALLVYAAVIGGHNTDVLYPSPPLAEIPLLKDDLLIRNMKFGKFSEWFNDVANTEITEVNNKALDKVCARYGAEIKEIDIPEIDRMKGAHLVTFGAEFLSLFAPFYDEWKSELSFETRAIVGFIRHFDSNMYISAQRLRRRFMNYFMRCFKDVDFIVTPASGMNAPHLPFPEPKTGTIDPMSQTTLMQFILAANFLGLPAIVVPVGYDKEGLPIGMQIIGRPWQEASLLRVAHAIQEVYLDSMKKPQVFYDLLQDNQL